MAARHARRCETCGRFVTRHHLKTARYHYAIDHTLPVAVYSLATACVFQERLDCAGCSMRCCRMLEAERDHGTAVGVDLPNGWERCDPQATQADYLEAA
jgi:hypothetical protein